MTKEELKLTSKEALERLEMVLNWNGDIDIDKDLYDLWVNLVCRTIEKDLDRLEKLEKVIEILKKALLLNVKGIRGLYYVLGYDTNYCMTKEEFELLKGVLENDSN